MENFNSSKSKLMQATYTSPTTKLNDIQCMTTLYEETEPSSASISMSTGLFDSHRQIAHSFENYVVLLLYR